MTGFADGAASFTYSRSGQQLALYFAIKAEPTLLGEVQAFFEGAGRIYDTYFRVSRRDELLRVVDHFDRYPLRSTKQEVYEVWRQMVMAKQEFRRPDRALLDSLAAQLTQLAGR